MTHAYIYISQMVPHILGDLCHKMEGHPEKTVSIYASYIRFFIGLLKGYLHRLGLVDDVFCCRSQVVQQKRGPFGNHQDAEFIQVDKDTPLLRQCL